jgi:SAM-dependent methyltransferase
MTRLRAATWVAPSSDADRGDVLGAAVVAAQRDDRELAAVVEGADRRDAAVAAGRDTGLLILPVLDRLLPDPAQGAALLRQAREEGWRLLVLPLGADSATENGRRAERTLMEMAARTPEERWTVPPEALIHRVAGVTGASFFSTGMMHVDAFEATLAGAGVSLGDAGDVLEWGAGCGRMTTPLLDRLGDTAVTVADTDAEAMRWVGDQLPVRAAEAVPVLPPTTLGTDAFDLVVGHSVFSHLDVRAQGAWLEELARVTRPGGHVAVSINGSVALTWHLEHPLVDVPQAVADAVARDGIGTWTGDGWEDEHYDGYHTTFVTHDYVRERWSRAFDVLVIDEAAALPTQDIVVLRAR